MKLVSHGNLYTIEHGKRMLTLTDRPSYLKRDKPDDPGEVVPGRIEVSEGGKRHAAVDYEHVYDEKPLIPLGLKHATKLPVGHPSARRVKTRISGVRVIKTEIHDNALWEAGLRECVRKHLAKTGHVAGL